MSNEQTSMKAAKPMSARRAQTRSRLIDAAAEVMAEKGIEAATLDDIAARVGLTKGAIYDNFEGKDDLILAVIIAKAAAPARPHFEPGAPLKAHLRQIGEAVAAFLPAAKAQAQASAQLDLYALAHEGMRQKLAGFYGRRIEMTQAALAEVVNEVELPMPLDQFAVVLNVFAAGIIYYWLMAPGQVTREFIVKAYEALAPERPGEA
jgi:AcrR family transcriptional regulator